MCELLVGNHLVILRLRKLILPVNLLLFEACLRG